MHFGQLICKDSFCCGGNVLFLINVSCKRWTLQEAGHNLSRGSAISKSRQSPTLLGPSGPRACPCAMYSIRVNHLPRQAASYASVAAGLAGAGGGDAGAGGSGQPSPSGSHPATPGDRTPTGAEVETDHITFSAGNPRVEHMVGAGCGACNPAMAGGTWVAFRSASALPPSAAAMQGQPNGSCGEIEIRNTPAAAPHQASF